MESRKKIGEKGEEVSKNYLKKNGYRILEKNFKSKRSEIDIIAQKNDCLVFVEVRAKANDHFGTPEETINQKKKWKLKQNAKGYVNFKKYVGFYRIDAICILFGENDKLKKISHYKNIIN